jgi:hypothetical protein
MSFNPSKEYGQYLPDFLPITNKKEVVTNDPRQALTFFCFQRLRVSTASCQSAQGDHHRHIRQRKTTPLLSPAASAMMI